MIICGVADTTLGDELRAIRTRLRYSQEEMARLLGVNRGAYKNWEINHAQPKLEIVEKARSLLGGHEPNATALPLRKASAAAQSLASGDLVLLPTWRARGGVIATDEFSFEEEDAEDPIGVPAFLCSPGPIKHYRAVVVSGFSMSPRIESGAIVIVRLADEAPTGVIAVVQADAGKLYVKTFKRDGYGNPELHSISDRFQPIDAVHLSGWRVRAVTTGIMHPYEPGRPNIEWDAGRPLRA